jgi:hypothetical protein
MSYRSRRRTQMSSSSSSGIGFSGLLTVLFIGLELTGHITWPWFWLHFLTIESGFPLNYYD